MTRLGTVSRNKPDFRRAAPQSLAGFLPKHMAIVGRELAHVREAQPGCDLYDPFRSVTASQQVIACSVEFKRLDEALGGGAKVVPEGILESTSACVSDVAEVIDRLRYSQIIKQMLFDAVHDTEPSGGHRFTVA